MIDFSLLPFSKAEPLNGLKALSDGFRFTYTECIDEYKIYSNLNKRLNALENTLLVNNEELDCIMKEIGDLRFGVDEKEELILRIEWLRRLYEVNNAIRSVETKELAESLRAKISTVQTCPLKNKLMTKLDSLAKTLPYEQPKQLQATQEQVLMENALEKCGNVFISLGKVGREYVIMKVIKRFGEKANVENVRLEAISLEKKVNSLTVVKNSSKLIDLLEDLPLQSYRQVNYKRKEKIAELLIQKQGWNGLASLDRKISFLLDKIIKEEKEKYERENVIDLPDGKAAASIDLRFHSID